MSAIQNVSVPVVVNDSFNDDYGTDERLRRGSWLKCVDGNWTENGVPFPPHTQLIAWAVTQALQLWKNGLPVETIYKQAGAPLPSVDDLNANIPREEWEEGLNGPRAPWSKQYVVYLINAADGSEYTYANNTAGAAAAYEWLTRRTANIRKIRNDPTILPVVTLGNKIMLTRFGQKLRPEFVVQDWRSFKSPAPPALLTAGNDRATRG